MIRNCLVLQTKYPQTIPCYLFNNKSNTCLNILSLVLKFKHYSVLCQSKLNNFKKRMPAYMTRAYNDSVIP